MLRPLTIAFLCGWRNRGDWRANLLLGLGVTQLTVYLHSFYEWAFITFPAQYMVTANSRLAAGLAQQLGYWSHISTQAIQSGRSARGDFPTLPATAAMQLSHKIIPNWCSPRRGPYQRLSRSLYLKTIHADTSQISGSHMNDWLGRQKRLCVRG